MKILLIVACLMLPLQQPPATAPSPVTAQMIWNKDMGDGTLDVAFNRGSDHAIAPGWKVTVVVDGQSITGPTFVVYTAKPKTSYARLRLPQRQLNRAAHVILSPP